jgi:cytoskeletal protein RodZ
MKRCPQCEFIYEDDQSLCDMDGKTLVSEGRPPDLPRGTTAGTSLPVQKSRLRSVMALLAALILTTVLFLVFFASPRLLAKPENPTQKPESNPQPATAPPAGKPASAPAATQSQTSPTTSSPSFDADSGDEFELRSPRTTQTNHTTPKPTDSRLTISRRLPPLPRVEPLPRLPEAKVADKSADPISAPRKPSVASPRSVGISQTSRRSTQRPVAAVQQKESRVSSFLKKTGRMLSKPFKR